MPSDTEVEDLRRRLDALEAVVRDQADELSDWRTGKHRPPEDFPLSPPASAESAPPGVTIQQSFDRQEITLPVRVQPLRGRQRVWLLMLAPPVLLVLVGLLFRAPQFLVLAPLWLGVVLWGVGKRRSRRPRIALTAQRLIWHVPQQGSVHLDEIERISCYSGAVHRIVVRAGGEDHTVVDGVTITERDWVARRIADTVDARRAALVRSGHDLDKPPSVPVVLQQLRQPT
jgi:hypothetical protein